MMYLSRLAIFISFCFILTGCIEYKDVEFLGIQGYSFDKVSTDIVNVKIDMKVQNPNTYNIKVKKTALDVLLNGNVIGKANMLDDIKLNKNSTDVYSIVFQTRVKDITKGLMGSLGSLLSGKVKVGFKGKVKAKAFGVGKKFDVDFAEDVNLKDLKF